MKHLTDNFVKQYLQRINYTDSLEPTVNTLHQLQLAHLYSVPFENLSIHLQQPIQLNDSSLADKIIQQNRGGFCYELNGLFSLLLQHLGFKVTLLSAQVAREDGTFGREFGHLTLLVKNSDNWLVDVGFGDSFIYPLKLESNIESIQREQRYKLVNHAEYWTLYQYKTYWKPQYRFQLLPRKLADFQTVCDYNQTNPQSIFKQRLICTKATPTGRVTLSDRKFIVHQTDQRNEQILETPREYQHILRKYFQIHFNNSKEIIKIFDFVLSK
jgi:N-hydroxyarylamine O-acetyltransferase